MANDPMINEAETRIRAELEPDESLLWAGRPRQGLVLRKGEWFNIPLTLLWLAFFVFWGGSAIRMGAPIDFLIAGTIFISIGLYLNIGRFWGDSYERSKTYYGLTDKRVIIIWGLLWQSVRSVPLEIIDDILVQDDVSQTVTINFIRKWSIMSTWLNDRWRYHRVPGVPQFESYVPPKFEMISNALPTIDIIQNAWDEAISRAESKTLSHSIPDVSIGYGKSRPDTK